MVLSRVYVIDATCFDECFLFHVIAGRSYFSFTFLDVALRRYYEIFSTAKLSFSLKQVF